MPIRVLIADDHEFVGEALSLYLSNEEDFQVLGSTRSGREALRNTLELDPDVLLLDLRLPDLDGLQILSALQTADVNPIVIIMTAFPSRDYVNEALVLGASGFLSKDVSLHLIPGIIRTVLSGKAVVTSPSLNESIHSETAPEIGNDAAYEGRPVNLNDLQLSILGLVAVGMHNQEIGEELSISLRQVNKALSTIYELIGVRHRTEAAIWANKHGIIS